METFDPMELFVKLPYELQRTIFDMWLESYCEERRRYELPFLPELAYVLQTFKKIMDACPTFDFSDRDWSYTYNRDPLTRTWRWIVTKLIDNPTGMKFTLY